MKKILATLAGTLSLALAAGACSAVDTQETKSIAPVTAPATSVVTPPVLNKNFDRFDYYDRPNRSVARPVKPVIPVKPVVKPKPVAKTPVKAKSTKTVKPVKKKVYKAKVKKKPVYKKTVKKTKKLKGKKVGLSGIAACIAKYESGGNPKAQNPHSTASGLFQFINGTWNHFGGYARAMYAPASVQLQKFYIVWNNGKGAGNWVVAHKCGY